MQKYANLSGDSGVVRYEVDEHSITVEFTNGSIYRYDGGRPGKRHVERMKRLAQAGQGLSAYISQHVRENYAARLR